MPRLDHGRHDACERLVAPQADHLAARHHDVAHLQIGDPQHPFEHRESIGIEHAALLGTRRASRRALRDPPAARPVCVSGATATVPWCWCSCHAQRPRVLIAPGRDWQSRARAVRGSRAAPCAAQSSSRSWSKPTRCSTPCTTKVRPVRRKTLALHARLGRQYPPDRSPGPRAILPAGAPRRWREGQYVGGSVRGRR